MPFKRVTNKKKPLPVQPTGALLAERDTGVEPGAGAANNQRYIVALPHTCPESLDKPRSRLGSCGPFDGPSRKHNPQASGTIAAPRRPQSIRQATGDWLRELWPWQVFATLTFTRSVGAREAFEKFTWFGQRLARDGRPRHVGLAWFADMQARGAVHFHMLVAVIDPADGSLEPAEVIAAWPWGDAHAQPYTGGNAPFYCLEHHRLWDVNVACPRLAACRRVRCCVYAPGPWPTPGACHIV
ncbi:MAG: hypothetical protein MUC50_19185 [Myxococcota bacterium]|nr:hypothetical protein [Myxococcota bacterium]